jgi:hypothetical protein
MTELQGYLGKIPHPYTGIRIPEILLPGILNCFKNCNVAGGMGLSFGRETAPEKIINSMPGEYPISQGHTGTSIRKYLTLAREYSEEREVPIELEADHLMVGGSAAKAIKKIAGVRENIIPSENEIKKSINYNKEEIDEGISTGAVNVFTTDASDLFVQEVDMLNDQNIEKLFQEEVEDGKEIIKSYSSQKFDFQQVDGKRFSVSFRQEEIKKIYLKYRKALEVTFELYNYIRKKLKKPFGFEISLDETPGYTSVREMLIYLNEWQKLGGVADWVAPNVGFKKRKNFTGDRKELKCRVSALDAIARKFGMLLSIHSGSGRNPWVGKGKDVYPSLLEGTGGQLKYKISGVYIELLFEIMASYPQNSYPRKLYEEIFDAVYKFMRTQIFTRGELYSAHIKNQLLRYSSSIRNRKREKRDPRAPFFRFYSYTALSLRDDGGDRIYRNKLAALYEQDREFRNKFDFEVEKLTERLIKGLNFENNVRFLK